jgi:HPt (histidine-containing phosphotransfer) domain-containing protein
VDFKFINPEYIESVSGGDKETIRELVDLFREQAVEFTSEMKTLLGKKDYYSLGLLAHKAKSSVAIIGMADLAVMLKTFELDAKEGRVIENYTGYIARFESETKSAVEELKKYVSNL